MPYTVGDICSLLAHRKGVCNETKKQNITSGMEQLFQQIPNTIVENRATIKPSKKSKSKKAKSIMIHNTPEHVDPINSITDADPNIDDERSKNKYDRKREESPTRLARTVFVGNLPSSITQKNIHHMFKPFGKIECIRFRSAVPPKISVPKRSAVIKKTFHPEMSTISSYVVFCSAGAAQAALSLNATIVGGRHVRVDLASQSDKHDHKRSIFVGNLPMIHVEEEELWEFFSDCGNIEGVRIVRDPHTGISKGFGYVLFEKPECVTLALEKNGTEFKNRRIRVNQSKEMKFKDRLKQRACVRSMNRVKQQKKKSQEESASFRGNFSNQGQGKKTKPKKKQIKKKLQMKKKKAVSEIIKKSAGAV